MHHVYIISIYAYFLLSHCNEKLLTLLLHQLTSGVSSGAGTSDELWKRSSRRHEMAKMARNTCLD